MTTSTLVSDSVGVAGAASGPARIVIVGAGYAGAYCAQALERRLDPRDAHTLLLDRHNFFVCYPLLVEAGTGSLEPRHTVVEIRAFVKNTEFKMADVVEADLSEKTVTYEIQGTGELETVRYDQLVLALGSVTRLPNIPGLAEHGFEIKSLTDAVALRDRAIQLLEAAQATSSPTRRRSLLHFVVVGGNFTGAEVAGEFHAFLRSSSSRYPHLSPDDVRITLIERADRILGVLDEDMSEYATRKLRDRGIEIRTNESVNRIEGSGVTLASGEQLEADTVIWCAGIAPNPLVDRMSVPHDEHGYVQCESDLRVRGIPDVWAIGDVANIPSASGRPYPATAQQAVRQGAHLAGNLARVLAGRKPLPFRYASIGVLAALGCRAGVARVFGVKLSGFPAWFLWRSVYLLKMPGWSRKTRVALDWTLDLVFPRESVQLGVHRQRPPS